MKADVLLGLQWGDEGKGKIVDVLTPEYSLVARFQGGPNAGHTLEFDDKKYVLHTIPSGIFHPACRNVIGSGVVIDPVTFHKEIHALGLEMGYIRKTLLISGKAHLILPSHRVLDAAYEQSKGNLKIGSTLKGIGPAYTDKFARSGLRIADIRENGFMEKYHALKDAHFHLIHMLGFDIDACLLDGCRFEAYEKLWFEGIQLIENLEQIESELYINHALDRGVKVLAEGAQGTLFDIDFGSYPYVTSSNTIAAGACTGLGLAPTRIGEVYGIFKAYCTRVGSGPFPTELFNEDGEKMRVIGNEYGSTTGRPRRCGWLDLPALKYSVMINGVSKLIMTKADVLNHFETLQICTAYQYKGQHVEYIPSTYEEEHLKPVYTQVDGWNADISSFMSIAELPASLLHYIRFIEEFVGVQITIVSTGPDRTQILR